MEGSSNILKPGDWQKKKKKKPEIQIVWWKDRTYTISIWSTGVKEKTHEGFSNKLDWPWYRKYTNVSSG